MFDILGRWGVSGGGAAGAPPQEQAKGHANNHHHGAHRMLQMRLVTEFDPVGERRWWSRQREGVAILVV